MGDPKDFETEGVCKKMPRFTWHKLMNKLETVNCILSIVHNSRAGKGTLRDDGWQEHAKQCM